jgi:Type IX secretion system protein PorV
MKGTLLLKPIIIALLLCFCGIQSVSAASEAAAAAPCACIIKGGRLVNPDGTPCNNALPTAVPFLRIIGDARSGGMGDAGIALSADANSMAQNASKTVFANSPFGVSATYTPWLRNLGLNDMFLFYAGGYYQLDKLQAVGASVRFFSYGTVEFTDENGTPAGTGRPNELEVSFGYMRKLSENFAVGVTPKWIYSNLSTNGAPGFGDTKPGNTGAVDFSFTYRKASKSNSLMVAAAMSNLGPKISYNNNKTQRYVIPTNLGIGVGYEMKLDEFNSLTFILDANKLLVPTPSVVDIDKNATPDYREKSLISGVFGSFSDAPAGFAEEIKEVTLSGGVEYWYDKQFSVRSGYYFEDTSKGGRQYLTVGLGFKYNVFGMNMSYLVPTTNRQNPLDGTLRFSLLFDSSAFAPDETN